MKSNKIFLKSSKDLNGYSLDDLLDKIQVIDFSVCDNTPSELQNWFGVASDAGIIAYFSEENDAFHFRLDYINRILN